MIENRNCNEIHTFASSVVATERASSHGLTSPSASCRPPRVHPKINEGQHTTPRGGQEENFLITLIETMFANKCAVAAAATAAAKNDDDDDD